MSWTAKMFASGPATWLSAASLAISICATAIVYRVEACPGRNQPRSAGNRLIVPPTITAAQTCRCVRLIGPYQASGDTQTAIYSNIKLNSPVDLKAFEIKCKGKCGS